MEGGKATGAGQGGKTLEGEGLRQLKEADLIKAVKEIVPVLSTSYSKGDCGKVGTIGGSREYTGAPYFAAISALKLGADLSHVFCSHGAAPVIKTYSPELIVHPALHEETDFDHKLSEDEWREQVMKGAAVITKWMDSGFHAFIVGPGLGRDNLSQASALKVLEALREKNFPVVVDADGLHIAMHNLELLKGYTNCILTPNKKEFGRLVSNLDIDEAAMKRQSEETGTPQDELTVREVLKRLDGPALVRKGAVDIICQGDVAAFCDTQGSNRRAGGQGDILSGALATMLAWTATLESRGGTLEKLGGPHVVVAAYGACVVNRVAARRAFRSCHRAMLAEDVIEELGEALDSVFVDEAQYSDSD